MRPRVSQDDMGGGDQVIGDNLSSRVLFGSLGYFKDKVISTILLLEISQ